MLDNEKSYTYTNSNNRKKALNFALQLEKET